MKELRPGSTGRTEIRVLFAFDKERRAVLLVGGDKSSNWSRWYITNVPIADERLDEHQTRIRGRNKAKATSATLAMKGKKKMSMKTWEEKVLETPGAPERVGVIEDELRLAAGLTVLREEAGLSQRELAKRIGVSQPRIVAIERSRNVTIDVLDQYVKAVGGRLEVTVVKGRQKLSLLSSARTSGKATSASPASTVASYLPSQRRVRTASKSSSSGPVAATKSRSKS